MATTLILLKSTKASCMPSCISTQTALIAGSVVSTTRALLKGPEATLTLLLSPPLTA